MINCKICYNNNILKSYGCLECNQILCNNCITNIYKKYVVDDNELLIKYKCPYCNCKDNTINIFDNFDLFKNVIKDDFIKLFLENKVLEDNLKIIKLLEKENDDFIDQDQYQFLNQIECHS